MRTIYVLQQSGDAALPQIILGFLIRLVIQQKTTLLFCVYLETFISCMASVGHIPQTVPRPIAAARL